MTMQPSAGYPWSVPVAVTDVPDSGRRFNLIPDAATRDAIAKMVGLAALPRLETEFELTRRGDDGLHVAGRVLATVGQICVATLDPIENEIDETIGLVFQPQPAPAAGAVSSDRSRATHVDEIDDTLEELRDGVVDLAAIAVEFLMLGIEPYPRKSGVVFEAPSADDDPASHPFAALAALKKGERAND